MDFNALLSSLTSYLGLGAAGAVLLFGAGVIVDDVLGVLKAHFKDKNFDPHKLGSFLETQVGTKRAAMVVASVAAAVLSAVAAQVVVSTPASIIVSSAEAVALSTAIAGSIAQFASVASDIKDKLVALLGK